MPSHVKVGAEHFIGSMIVVGVMAYLNWSCNLRTFGINAFIMLITFSMIFVLNRMAFTDWVLKVSLRAALLGGLFSLGIYIYLAGSPQYSMFGLYMTVMAFFHWSEFMTIAIIQPTQVSADSFVLNHSPQYIIAAVVSWVEFFIEAYYFPDWKTYYLISHIGFFICVAGETLRKVAMFTAGRSFSHLVQFEKAKEHVLVDTGIYAWFRHPSYVGWFYWAIGTQMILLNPICIPAYVAASWTFFNGRIYVEEILLLNFFGQNYIAYQKRVGTGIPFIKGYRI